ncbi:MAG: hypothetical protein KDE19_12245 [Caldilineaceae bacterium]|nr:hypothetical protein [Caldilineaceae bacterium]
MAVQDITIHLPEALYLRFRQAAEAMQQPLEDVVLHAAQVGSPPSWEDAPAEFQADLAAMDRLPDSMLWRIARSHQLDKDMTRYQELLDKNADGLISDVERTELTALRKDADRFMLSKAYAVDLLRWRGHVIPPAQQLVPLP